MAFGYHPYTTEFLNDLALPAYVINDSQKYFWNNVVLADIDKKAVLYAHPDDRTIYPDRTFTLWLGGMEVHIFERIDGMNQSEVAAPKSLATAHIADARVWTEDQDFFDKALKAIIIDGLAVCTKTNENRTVQVHRI
jgi:hypothetical protein